MRTLLFSLILILLFLSCSPQREHSPDCGEIESPYSLSENYFNNVDTITLGIRFVVILPSMETSAISVDSSLVLSSVSKLNEKFSQARVQFFLTGIHEMRDDDQFNHIEEYKLHVLDFKRFARRVGYFPSILCFIYPPSPNFSPGRALGIPSDAFIIQLHVLNESTVVHEMGHCLGLYHTHEKGEISENPYKSGDQCCDTPSITSYVDLNCKGGSRDKLNLSKEEFQVLSRNYMSYVDLSCRENFTQDQIDKIRFEIERQPFLTEKIIL